jgi:hypothetical protein
MGFGFSNQQHGNRWDSAMSCQFAGGTFAIWRRPLGVVLSQHVATSLQGHRALVNTRCNALFLSVWTSKTSDRAINPGESMKIHHSLCVALLAVLVSACATTSTPSATATLQGDAAHPAQTQGWVDTKLYFGLGPADQPSQGISEAAWRDFLDKEVTPRFPDGLSVLDVYGQWQGKQETAPERLHSKLLVIDYPDTADNRSKIEAIRTAWKRRTGDQSVLRVTQPADVSF